MKLTLKEAAEAAADVFEGNPGAFTTYAYGRTGLGTPTYDRPDGPEFSSFCAVGAVAVAANVTLIEAGEFLRPFSGYDSPEVANNRGRRYAIRMLRKAAA